MSSSFSLKAHVKNVIREASKVLGDNLDNLRVRKFGDDCRKKMMKFDSLVKSILCMEPRCEDLMNMRRLKE